jgi:hypothetical protein
MAVMALGQAAHRVAVASAPSPQPSPSPETIASIVDGEIGTIEKQLVDAAEAMPDDKFDFSPESLDIPGDDYKGVRTFGVQVKHVAASNYFLWASITGDKLRMTTKAEMVQRSCGPKPKSSRS